jgi:hypothetical protein
MCGNYVALLYGSRFVDPRDALRPNWNARICKGAQRITKRFWLLRCRSKKDLLTLQMLQALVKEEDSRFLFARDTAVVERIHASRSPFAQEERCVGTRP